MIDISISGGIQAALDDEFDSIVNPVVSSNTLAFFSFEDTGGTEYFGFYWLTDLSGPKQLTFTASATGASGLQTNTTFTSAPIGETFTSFGTGDSYYYLYSGVGPGSSIAMSGLVPNVEIQWLDWDGSAWQLLGSGSRTGVAPGNEGFALANATAVPGGSLGALTGAGLVGRLIGRRRGRASR
ncbi:MAG: hypothetical protein ACO3ZZ_08780 [Solirubrobacterales bacterium]